MSPFPGNGRDQESAGRGEPESASTGRLASQKVPDDLGAAMAEAMLHRPPSVDTRHPAPGGPGLPAGPSPRNEAGRPSAPNHRGGHAPPAGQAAEPTGPVASTAPDPGLTRRGEAAALASPRGSRLLLAGAGLAFLAAVVGAGLLVVGLIRADEQVQAPLVADSADDSGAAAFSASAGPLSFSLSEALPPLAITAAAAAAELTTGARATGATPDNFGVEPSGVTMTGGEVILVDGRLKASVQLSDTPTSAFRFRLNLTQDEVILVSHELAVSSSGASSIIVFREDNDVVTLPGSLEVVGNQLALDWDLAAQVAPPIWSGLAAQAITLALTLDTSPPSGSDSAFLRYEEEFGPIVFDQSLFSPDSTLGFQAATSYRAEAYWAADPSPATTACLLTSLTVEGEETARFTPSGVGDLTLPCLLANQFATSPTGRAAALGLAGFATDPAEAVDCLASGLESELATLQEYQALSAGDYTSWSPHVTDSYASALEACIELRPFYLTQFSQYEFQRATCPDEMTEYVLANYSWKAFITEGILDSNPIRRQQNQAAFDTFVSAGYESIGCFIAAGG